MVIHNMSLVDITLLVVSLLLSVGVSFWLFNKYEKRRMKNLYLKHIDKVDLCRISKISKIDDVAYFYRKALVLKRHNYHTKKYIYTNPKNDELDAFYNVYIHYLTIRSKNLALL